MIKASQTTFQKNTETARGWIYLVEGWNGTVKEAD